MRTETVRDLLIKSDLTLAQSEALANLIAEMREEFATKHDVALLRAEVVGMRDNMATKADLAALKASTTADLAAIKEGMAAMATKVEMANLETRITRAISRQTAWMISVIIVLATLISVLNRIGFGG